MFKCNNDLFTSLSKLVNLLSFTAAACVRVRIYICSPLSASKLNCQQFKILCLCLSALFFPRLKGPPTIFVVNSDHADKERDKSNYDVVSM